MYLVNAQQMREIDRFTIDSLGVPGSILMEHAGMAVVEEIEKKGLFKQVAILCGHGNNGGDGFVIARLLQNRGYHVTVWMLGDEQRLSIESRLHYRAWQRYGGALRFFQKGDEDWQYDVSSADLIVDAMLGTGVRGELRQPYQQVISFVNQLKEREKAPYMMAVDLPSGVDGDSGKVGGTAFSADTTIALALPKWGHYLYPGAGYTGEMIIKDIAIPDIAVEQVKPQSQIVTEQLAFSGLPVRNRHSHKGTYGHVLLASGSQEMRGAPVLAAKAALRSGTGMVTMALPSQLMSGVSSQVTEAVMWEWPELEGHFTSRPADWEQKISRFSCAAIGPGIGTWAGGEQWLLDWLKEFEAPLVLDADALNLLARRPTMLDERSAATILTPHPGEMARLSGMTVQEVEAERPQIALSFAKRYQVYVVLKGTYSLIACPDGTLYLSTTGSSAMAKGGSGDVLTGMIASFIAQGGNVKQAMLTAVYLHGLTGEICGEKRSNYSVLARDLVEHIPAAIKKINR